MTYVERNMRRNEVLVKKARISWAPMIPTILFWIIAVGIAAAVGEEMILAGAVGCAVLSVLIKAVIISSVELGVTNKKIIGKTGVVIAMSIDAYLEKIDNFSISESLGGKIFGYATIQISTTSQKLRFGYVKNAMDFKNTVMDTIDAREDERLRKQAEYISNMSAMAQHNGAPVQEQPAPIQNVPLQETTVNPFQAAAQNPAVCSVCGAYITNGAAFCRNCGTPV
ncbi:MAG: PH domain-containing protein [Ruminococcus sp.]|nr:PH domain-containing protein [Ruminococcus sp.]